jgi:UDP-2,4-diacetamido-2,4,6-trideoxy-beta-L-altropyranose hydrolase
MTVIYGWRNDERTRQHFRNPDPLSWDGHREWFCGALSGDACDLLIGNAIDLPVGVLRYDHDTAQSEVSIYLDPEQTKKGLGMALLSAGNEWIFRNRKGIAQLVASIHPDNTASIRAFEKAGFTAIDRNGSFHLFGRNTEHAASR